MPWNMTWEYSKQTLTACNNLLEMADVIREKAKEYSKLSLQLSDAEKDVIKYKNAKEKMNGYNKEIQRYQENIKKNGLRNEQIAIQIGHLTVLVPDNIEEKINELTHVREKVAKEDVKRYQSAVAEHELQEIKASYSERILEAGKSSKL